MEKDILATLKKHIDSGAIEPTPKEVSRAQIHTFGENMKGINEFIGAVQMLSLNLNKIKNLSEKIEWINDLLSQESNENTARNATNATQRTHRKYQICVWRSEVFGREPFWDKSKLYRAWQGI